MLKWPRQSKPLWPSASKASGLLMGLAAEAATFKYIRDHLHIQPNAHVSQLIHETIPIHTHGCVYTGVCVYVCVYMCASVPQKKYLRIKTQCVYRVDVCSMCLSVRLRHVKRRCKQWPCRHCHRLPGPRHQGAPAAWPQDQAVALHIISVLTASSTYTQTLDWTMLDVLDFEHLCINV